eukprot:1348721-Amorphochlora_amoeboformis.AAC.2
MKSPVEQRFWVPRPRGPVHLTATMLKSQTQLRMLEAEHLIEEIMPGMRIEDRNYHGHVPAVASPSRRHTGSYRKVSSPSKVPDHRACLHAPGFQEQVPVLPLARDSQDGRAQDGEFDCVSANGLDFQNSDVVTVPRSGMSLLASPDAAPCVSVALSITV